MSPRSWTGTIMSASLVAVAMSVAGTEPARGQGSTVDLDATAQISGLPAEAAVYANRPGFCLDLGCGDGALACRIARQTKYTVFAVAREDADCQKTRQTLDGAGLYGIRATAVAGSLQTIPLPDGYGNLVVTGAYQDDLNLKEVLRVLSPNGLAVIGGGRADAGRLKTAVEAAGIKQYRLSGSFVIFSGRLPEGAAEWTHFTPGPDNNNVSPDPTIRPPFRTQWIQEETARDSGFVSHAAVAGGRLIFRDWGGHYTAWDSFNGTRLWTRYVASANFYRYALVDGTFYATENDRIVALDAATGRQKQEYGAGAGCWLWLAVQRGTLYGMCATQGMPKNSGDWYEGNLLCAFDIDSGERKWKSEIPTPAISTSVALGDGGIYFCCIGADRAPSAPGSTIKAGKAAVCALEAETGRQRWLNQDCGQVQQVEKLAESACAGAWFQGRYYAWIFMDGKSKLTRAFDGKTGKMVKQYPAVRSSGWLVTPVHLIGDRIYARPTHNFSCTDIASGEQMKTPIDRYQTPGCGIGSATGSFLFSGGQGFAVLDLATGRCWEREYNYFRTACGNGPYLAEGMLFRVPVRCGCPYLLGDGPTALTSAGTGWSPPDADKDIAARLVRGPAFDSPLAGDEQDAWTHFRGNPGHAGETANAPKMPLAMGWQRKLDEQLTAPSFGAGLAFVASRGGCVWALDAVTGAVRWKFLAGGGVRQTPAYHRGRVLIGSADGWVYCLDAASGHLAWRFRAAPEEHYVNVEGQMCSTWPVAAGVVARDGVAYCAAGLFPYDGTYLYALDVKTGQPVWARRIGDIDGLDAPAQGCLTLAADRLIIPGNTSKGRGCYRKDTGERVPWGTTKDPNGKKLAFFIGRHIGSEAVADGDMAFIGGPQFIGAVRGGRGNSFFLYDATTGWVYGNIDQGQPPELAPAGVAPVLGKRMIVGNGIGYDRQKFSQIMQQGASRIDEAKALSFAALAKSSPRPPAGAQVLSGLALAGDIVLASGTDEVVAFEAGPDGKALGRTTLPGTILRNSLAVSDGRVFAVTEDGSVCCLKGE